MNKLIEMDSFNFVEQSVIKNRDRSLFLSLDQKKYTYLDIERLSNNFTLFNLNHSLVICLIDNNADALLGYLSLLYLNAIPLMAVSSLPVQDINKLINKYQPSYIFCNKKTAEELKIKHMISVGDYGLSKLQTIDYKINNNLALLLPTSGSTGSPKYVRLSYKNLYSNAIAISKYLNLSYKEIPITTLPPSYTYGLSILHSHVLVGSKIAVSKLTFFNKAFWDFIQESKVTSLAGVPYHYEILNRLKFTKMQLPYIKTLTQAGGKLKPDLVRKFSIYCKENDKKFFIMYGQTEATARMSFLETSRIFHKEDSIGKTIPGGKFYLMDENKNVISGTNAIGELVFKGDNVSMGYALGFKDLSRDDDNNGILFTGDLARIDEQGFYYIIGRKKRFIKIFSKRVNLDEMESFLLANNYQTICLGEDDLLKIYAENLSIDEAATIKLLAKKYLNISNVIINLFSVPQLPRNSAGKLSPNLLKSMRDISKVL